jgi:predicted RNA methylase
MTDLTALAKEAEAYETPRWAVEAILRKEILSRRVLDPCCGKGVLGDVANDCGYTVFEFDKYDWGLRRAGLGDFLVGQWPVSYVADRTVFMNPPFSLAEEFVERSFELKARKIVCFQRFAWWESAGRRDFWEKCPPNRVYICGNRASCWRFDIPEDQRKSSSTTAHAWYIWERGQPPGTVLGHIYRSAE